MGSCGNINQKERRKRINEEIITGSKIRSIDSCLFEVCPSICKILYPTQKGIKKGAGFLIKLYKEDEPLFCLMTNDHIITKEVIEKKTEIEVFYFNGKKRIKIILDQKERLIHSYKDMDIDCMIIEILDKDNVNEDYYLLPNEEYNDNNFNELNNKKIYVVQFPKGMNLSYSVGEIIKKGGA